MAEKTILLTGYPPFGNHTINPSGMAAQALDGKIIAGYKVRGAVLPCDHLLMPPALASLIEETSPAMVIGTGLAFSSPQIRLERLGVNLLNFGKTPDNGNHLMINQPALKGGPEAYFSTLPLPRLVKYLRSQGIPASLSEHAGGHLCNMMLYTASHLVAQLKTDPKPLVGFVHIPGLPHQAAEEAERENLTVCAPSMSLEMIIRALELVLEVSAEVYGGTKDGGN